MSSNARNRFLPILSTKTGRYFANAYHTATWRGAVEAAARIERERLLSGLEDFCHVPVDVNAIGERRGLRIVEDLPSMDRRDAELQVVSDGFLVHLKPGVPEKRKRFTIAHEIGHSLFYRNGQHQIGILDEREIQAEEIICHEFARALLLPREPVRESLKLLMNASAWSVLNQLEGVVNRFQVSMPALVARLGAIKLYVDPILILILRYRNNQKTGQDPKLRIIQSVALGGANPLRTFSNQSVEGLHFQSAWNLFSEWKDQLRDGLEITGGRYAWHPNRGLFRPTPDTELPVIDQIELSIQHLGRWHKEVVQVSAAIFLYSRSQDTEHDAYVVAVLKPSEKLAIQDSCGSDVGNDTRVSRNSGLLSPPELLAQHGAATVNSVLHQNSVEI